MDFKNHLEFIRMCRTTNINKGTFLRTVYELIQDHLGKDFKDLDDLFSKLYPRNLVQVKGAGVNIRHRQPRHQRRGRYDQK